MESPAYDALAFIPLWQRAKTKLLWSPVGTAKETKVAKGRHRILPYERSSLVLLFVANGLIINRFARHCYRRS